jgi:adenylyltransferase/sulfurtransferase
VTAARVSPSKATALVLGVGGIGCPAALSLAEAGVGSLLLVDFDVVEPSNLPRQFLFREDDVGKPKAVVAAKRLARTGARADAVVGRFDEESGPALLARADVVVDALDGAASKDLANALAARAGKPFVHAAAIGHEGRVLDVPAGGAPCLACLFGTGAADEGDSCASFGVVPTVTALVGFLAAKAALDRLLDPRAPSKGLRVIDLETGRGVTLEARADPACPACGSGRGARAGSGERPARTSARESVPAGALDLRSESCPTNLLLAKRAVERLAPGGEIEIWLGEEGAGTVPTGLRSAGHRLVEREERGGALRIRVRRVGGRAS